MANINELIASQKMLSLLEEANNNAEKLLDDFPSVFALVTESGDIIRANKAFCELLGQPLDTT